MKIVFAVKSDKKSEAENLVRADDLVNRQSITIRSADSMDMGKDYENSYFIMVEGSEEALHKAEELLKDIAKKLEEKDANIIAEKIKEEEDRAIEGFGNILS